VSKTPRRRTVTVMKVTMTVTTMTTTTTTAITVIMTVTMEVKTAAAAAVTMEIKRAAAVTLTVKTIQIMMVIARMTIESNRVHHSTKPAITIMLMNTFELVTAIVRQPATEMKRPTNFVVNLTA
jgi:hypothetical protein